MKVLINKVTEIGKDSDGKGGVDYKQLILNCLDYVPTAQSGQPIGFSRSEMRDRDRIEKSVDDSEDEDEIKFEDSDANNLKRIVDNMKWAMRHKEILAFIDAVDNMKKVKKKKKNEIEEEAKKKDAETEDIEEETEE